MIAYQVYVIQNPQGQYYIGLSEDIHKRLIDHNSGISQWTKNKGPWKLVWNSEKMTMSEARKFENLLKRQKGGLGFFNHTGLKRSSDS